MTGFLEALVSGGAFNGAGSQQRRLYGNSSVDQSGIVQRFEAPTTVPNASAFAAGADQPGLLERFETHMENPLVAAAMGAGGALLNNASQGGSLGQGVASGLGGGLGGAYGAMRQKRYDALLERQLRALERAAGISKTYQPVFPHQAPGAAFDAFAALRQQYGNGAFAQQPGMFS